MTAHKRMIKGGFTLVEILIVVVILGILAAIVIPQFTNASESAKASSLTSTLQTIRSQLELAKVQHKGVYPVLVSTDGTGWATLTETSETDTTYTHPGDASGDEVGPYLQQAPANPFAADGVDQTSVANAPATTGAWQYDPATGEIMAVVSMTGPQAEALGLLDDGADLTSSNDVIVVAP